MNTTGKDSEKQVSSGNEMVIVGNSIGTYRGSGKDGIILGNAATATTNNITNHTLFSSTLDNNTDYRLTVKVVGTTLTATVAKADDGTVVYTGSETIKAGEGYLSFGASNYKRQIKSVSVTELDESGNAVDFGKNTPLPYSTFDFDPADMTKLYSYSGHYWTFTDKTDSNATLYRNAVSEKFNTYYNNASNYAQYRNWILPKDYLKLREITLSYSLPKAWLKQTPFSMVQVSLIGRNLFMWTPKKNNYVDPEGTNYGNDILSEIGEFGAAPTNRTFGGGIKVVL